MRLHGGARLDFRFSDRKATSVLPVSTSKIAAKADEDTTSAQPVLSVMKHAQPVMSVMKRALCFALVVGLMSLLTVLGTTIVCVFSLYHINLEPTSIGIHPSNDTAAEVTVSARALGVTLHDVQLHSARCALVDGLHAGANQRFKTSIASLELKHAITLAAQTQQLTASAIISIDDAAKLRAVLKRWLAHTPYATNDTTLRMPRQSAALRCNVAGRLALVPVAMDLTIHLEAASQETELGWEVRGSDARGLRSAPKRTHARRPDTCAFFAR